MLSPPPTIKVIPFISSCFEKFISLSRFFLPHPTSPETLVNYVLVNRVGYDDDYFLGQCINQLPVTVGEFEDLK